MLHSIVDKIQILNEKISHLLSHCDSLEQEIIRLQTEISNKKVNQIKVNKRIDGIIQKMTLTDTLKKTL